MTKDWLEDCEADPHFVDQMAEPLWLLATVHQGQGPKAGPLQAADVLAFEPVVSQLVPAARCFLEARRCSPFLAFPHAELASVDYLLAEGNHSASTYVTRALSLAGNNDALLAFLAQVAVHAGDRKLASLCWRKTLAANPSSWPEVADAARMVLSADELLTYVAADGQTMIRFADRLYSCADQRLERVQFLHTAMERLALDREVPNAERLYWEAHASAGLELSEQACERMEAALAQQPDHTAWREEYIAWLLQWGQHDRAHRQALIGLYFSPDSENIRSAVNASAEALARGRTDP